MRYETFDTEGNLLSSHEDNSDLPGRLAAHRFSREVAGVPYRGKTIQTDRETRANWIGILISAQSTPSYSVVWKTMDGSFDTYSAAQAVGAALTVSAYVQKCFAVEAVLTASIDNGYLTTEDQVTAAFDLAMSS